MGEIQESVKTGLWVGDCFIYTNGVNRLNYYVGGEIVTISHLDRTMYLLGYIPGIRKMPLKNRISSCQIQSVHSRPENLKKSMPKNSSNEINQFHGFFFWIFSTF